MLYKVCEECKKISNGKTERDFVQQLKVSKKILARHSPYFQAMFYGGFSEGSKSHVKLEGIRCSTLKDIVKYTNGELVELPLNFNTVFEILEAAAMLQFSAIQKQCCQFLVSKINVENVIDILSFAEQLSVQDMFNKAFAFILYHFEKVVNSPNFAKLDERTLQKVVKSKYLRVKNESLVYEAVSKWVKVDEKSRNIFGFIELFRTSDLSEKQLQDINFDNSTKNQDLDERRLPKYPCCVGRYKKSPYIFLFDTEAVKLEPLLTLSGKVTSNNGLTATGFQAGSTGTSIYVLGGEFSLGKILIFFKKR